MKAAKSGNKHANKKVKKAGKSVAGNKKVGDTPPKRKYRIFLRDANDLKRLMSASINELRRGEITPLVAGKLFYGVTVMLQIFEQIDLAGQLKELERAAKAN